MKKKIIVISILVILIVTLLLIPKDIYKKIFNKEESNDNLEPTISLEYQTMYVKDSNNQLVGIEVGVEKLLDDVVMRKWELLTSKSDLLPNGFSSPVNKNTTLYSHVIENDKLYLDVSEDFASSDGRITLESLAWNFCDDAVTEVVVKVNDKICDKVNEYCFKSISKKLGTNFVFEAKDLFSSNYLTVVYHENDMIKPVTYFYDDNKNVYDYTISKIFKNSKELSELVSSKAYTYKIQDTSLEININYEGSLNDDLVNTIIETSKLNFNLSSLVVNGSQTVILQKSFIGDKA